MRGCLSVEQIKKSLASSTPPRRFRFLASFSPLPMARADELPGPAGGFLSPHPLPHRAWMRQPAPTVAARAHQDGDAVWGRRQIRGPTSSTTSPLKVPVPSSSISIWCLISASLPSCPISTYLFSNSISFSTRVSADRHIQLVRPGSVFARSSALNIPTRPCCSSSPQLKRKRSCCCSSVPMTRPASHALLLNR